MKAFFTKASKSASASAPHADAKTPMARAPQGKSMDELLTEQLQQAMAARVVSRPTTPSAAPPPPPWTRKQNRLSDAQQQQQQPTDHDPRDQVVVGITASRDDDVEDWTDDFMDSSNRGALERPRRESAGDRVGELPPRFTSTFQSASTKSALRRASVRWQRQHSLDSNAHSSDLLPQFARNSRLRKSSGDATSPHATTSSTASSIAAATSGNQKDLMAENQSQKGVSGSRADALDLKEEQDAAAMQQHVVTSTQDKQKQQELKLELNDDDDDGKQEEDDEDDEEEDWDVEFGFADQSDDEQGDTGAIGSSRSVVDSNRRRSENFNIFLRNFHDMMDGDDLPEDDDDEEEIEDYNDEAFLQSSLRKSNKRGSSSTKKPADEPLFQRKRNTHEYHHHHSSLSLDGSNDGASTSRASLTSVNGGNSAAVEYTLLDKYRILDVAASSAYAVRIERYPKPCTTYSNLEKDAGFPSFSEYKFERWLESFVSSKCDLACHVMDKERDVIANPRAQKNHQFKTLVSLPFGKEFVANFYKQVSLYRYFGEEKSNRELVRVFFEKVSTTGYSDEDWSLSLSSDDYEYTANCTMEILQEAARMYGPKPPTVVTNWGHSTSSSSSSQSQQGSNSATMFWMRQFQSILQICAEAFPKYRHVIALIELRYVCHHLVGFTNGDFVYTWQICNQLPAFCPMESIAGEAAPSVANEILEYYGALFVHLNTSPESRNSWQGENPPSEATTKGGMQQNALRSISFGISPDAICLQALILCDIQCLYESKSVLAEVTIPDLVELFEFEDDDMNIDPRLMELLDTEVKVQTTIPGLYPGGSRGDGDHPRLPERRNSSGGLGGWSTESRLLTLLKPSSSSRISALGFFYERIAATTFPLVKAKCASVLGGMHILTGSLTNLRVAESLAYEAVRLLEACSSKKLEPFTTGVVDSAEALCVSMFNNDGLLSELGREALEMLGNVLIKNEKYRYGILVLEAAGTVFSFLNQGCAYEKLDRLLCSLTLQADDVHRALPLHEKVAFSARQQGNINEYVYLTQALTNLWIREGNFARAEENLLSAFRYLREYTNILPPSFLACLYGSYSSSDTAGTSSRSGTMLTTSTSSSSISGSFHLASRGLGNTSELDTWLNHDISLHLLVREIYRSSGRCLEGMQVLQHVLGYSSRLPRGKRTHLRMLLAEDSLKMYMFDTCRYMFGLLDQEANLFCERLNENILSSTIGSSSGGGGGGGSSSGGGRSMSGLGSEARFCFDMVFSIRYVVCRAKFYLKIGNYKEAFAWLSLAHIKSDKDNLRKQAQLHFLDGKALFGLFQEYHESRRSYSSASSKVDTATIAAEVERMVHSFAGSLYGLNTQEKETLKTRMAQFCECAKSVEKCVESGVKSFWKAFDQYQSIDDVLHQLKSLLEIINFSLAPIERSFFALGSNLDDDVLKSHLQRGSASGKRSGSSHFGLDESLAAIAADDDIIERTRRSVLDAQKLLRRAMNLAEQVADPACLLRTLIFCSEAWVWLERIASYKNDKMVKEAAAFWEEGVKILNAVFLRRVAFHNCPQDAMQQHYSSRFHGAFPSGHARSTGNGTFSVVPILNFSEGFILKLEHMTLQLIFIACQLQLFERVPEYVEEMLALHLDELLSARMCLSSISQQLSAFRDHQRSTKRVPQSSVATVGSAPTTSTPRNSVSVSAGDAGSRAASFTSSSSSPGLHSSSSGNSSSSSSATAKRKGHKKNQSMSSISELLASSGASAPSTSFHDVSSSFIGNSKNGSFLGNSTTPRTGLASLSERGGVTHRPPTGPGTHPPLMLRRGHAGFDRNVRTRGRSRSAPQPIVPSKHDSSEKSQAHNGEPHELLTPVHESGAGASDILKPRIIDLADVNSWGHDDFGSLVHEEDGDYGVHGEGSSSGGAIGLYDFDEVQSEKLWWIFNMWRDSKAKYTNGKLESSAFRTLNLRNLRTLLDTFDPHQVAVLYVGGVDNSSLVSSNGSNAGKVSTVNGCGIVGFDVAHINSYALIQDKNLVLSIGYDLDKGSHFGYSQLKFKVFSVKPGETSCWRSEIPRSDWYLKHYDQIEADCASPGVGALRTLRLLGPKILVKLLGLLLLENAIVVTGTSFPQVKEVALSLLKLLKPFRWQHTFVPFVCITSWRFLYDTCHLFSQAQLASRPKSRKSFSRLSSEWRWGSSSTASTLPSLGDALDFEDPPFLLGTTTETWQTCMVHAKSLGEDARTITSYVTVVDLDNLDTFTIAKNSPNAVGLPRKWRKHFLERFDKVVKQRRKVQYKTSRRMTRQLPPVPSTPGEMSATSTSQGGSIAQSSPNHQHHTADEYRHLDMTHRSVGDDLRSSRSASTWMSQGEAGLAPGGQLFVSSVLSAEATSASGPDDRLYYDMECFDAFMVLLHDFYNKLVSLCEEKDKKMLKSGHKKKKSSGGLSKRQEIKAWFSSSHDFDAFVDKFQESEVYLEFEKDKELQAAAAAATSTTTGSERVHSQSGYSESGSTAPGSATHTSSSHFVTLSARSSGGSSGTAILGARTPHQLKSASSMSSVSSAGMGL